MGSGKECCNVSVHKKYCTRGHDQNYVQFPVMHKYMFTTGSCTAILAITNYNMGSYMGDTIIIVRVPILCHCRA